MDYFFFQEFKTDGSSPHLLDVGASEADRFYQPFAKQMQQKGWCIARRGDVILVAVQQKIAESNLPEGLYSEMMDSESVSSWYKHVRVCLQLWLLANLDLVPKGVML